MNLAKSLFLGISLALVTSTPTFAHGETNQQSINRAEKNALAIIAAVDLNEILASIVAENKKANSDVIDYAKMMIDQHGSNLTQILEMQKEFKTGPLHSDEAEKLAKQSKQDVMKLGGLQGKEFDTAYADAMVKGHTAALKLIDDKLMKSAKSAQVKTFLTNTRSAVAEHLEEAKKLQADLKS